MLRSSYIAGKSWRRGTRNYPCAEGEKQFPQLARLFLTQSFFSSRMALQSSSTDVRPGEGRLRWHVGGISGGRAGERRCLQRGLPARFQVRSYSEERERGEGGRGRCPCACCCVIGQRVVVYLYQKVCLHKDGRPVVWRRCGCCDSNPPLGWP